VNKIAIQRANGITRIGILCEGHTSDAIGILVKAGKEYRIREYDGPQICEACGQTDYLHVEEG